MDNQRKKKRKKKTIGRKYKKGNSQISGQSVEDIDIIIPSNKYTRYNESQKGKSRTQKAKKVREKAIDKYRSTEKGKKTQTKAIHVYSATEKGKKKQKKAKQSIHDIVQQKKEKSTNKSNTDIVQQKKKNRQKKQNTCI
ncbi:unnamed protein product [Meganyctiphanes norvegica]|uniref:Uncharacterized protein n=1 Tax=Meganyctiphanes norvegica TaxID=48144 RepID=A0AAV2RWG6_MEGNR